MTRRPRPLFVYGTLLDPAIRAAVIGRRFAGPLRPARLTGYRRWGIQGADYPAIAPAFGGSVPGGLLARPDGLTLRRLDSHEGPEYVRRAVSVRAGGRLIGAEAYVAAPGARLARRPWRLDGRWRRRRAAYLRRMAFAKA